MRPLDKLILFTAGVLICIALLEGSAAIPANNETSMSPGEITFVCVIVLAAPAAALMGAGAGSWATWRLLQGKSPLPPLPSLRRSQAVKTEPPKPPSHKPPKVGA